MDKQFYFPWVRKGLGAFIDEKESLEADGTILCRPELTVKSTYTARHNQPKEGEDEETSGVVLEKTVKFVGPGDILKINPSAVMKVHPEEGSAGFPIDYLPYIEFWEPDFLWRYTPASADEAKLRPWLMLVTVKKDNLRVFTPAEGLPYFSVDEKDWDTVFPTIADHVCSAHAQGRAENRPDFCRLLGMRKEASLVEGTEYVALLIPAYETGRLRGLGLEEEDIQAIPAQQASWSSFDKQKARKRGTEFPIYYQWSFKTGKESFDAIASRLAPVGVEKSGIKLDVTDMGEGFSYNTVDHANARKAITMPAATKTIDFKEEPAFPAEAARKWSDEGGLYTNLKKLLGKSPVFIENQADIAGVAISEQDSEDPWVVPPVYGARHVMSTKLHDKNAPWVQELNMDVHHRAAAGLGRKIVQQHQEELMDRAWKQVEAVQALNNELYERLMSIQTNRALRGKTVDQFTDSEDNSKYVEYMMRYLSSMRNAGSAKYSLSSILKKAGIPESFASPSFHNNAERLARIVEGMDTTTLMDQIVKDQIFRFKTEEPVGTLDPERILRWADSGKDAIMNEVYKKYWKRFFSVKYAATANKDNSYSYRISSVSLKKISFGASPLQTDESDTLPVSVQAPFRFLEAFINDFSKKACASSGVDMMVFNFFKDAIVAFNPEEYHFYPRVYTIDSSVFSEVANGNIDNIQESALSLSFTVNGKKHSPERRAISIPAHLHRAEFGLHRDIVHFGDSQYAFTSYERLQSQRVWWWKAYPTTSCDYYSESFPAWNELRALPCGHCTVEAPETKEISQINLIALYLSMTVSDDKQYTTILAGLVKKIRGIVEANYLESFKQALNKIFSEAEEIYPGYNDKYSRYMLSQHLSSTLDGKISNYDLNKIPVFYKKEITGGILYMLLALKNRFLLDKLCNDGFDGHTALSTLCFLKYIGPCMLTVLALRLANIGIDHKMWEALVRIDDFLRANPAFILLRTEDYDNLTRVHTSPEDCLKQGSVSYFPDEVLCVNEVYGLADSLKTTQSYHSSRNDPSVKPVDDNAVTDLQKEVENEDAYARMREIAVMYYQHFFADDEEGARLRSDYLDDLLRSKYPILAYPIFPEPTYYYLDMFSDKFIIPGLDEIPMDGIAMFKNNPTFTEAYLCGMNTEMGAELQWREYPTDRRGSYFRKFWDSESTVEAVRNDSFFDIKPVHLWEKTKLGENHQEGKGNLLIFAIHSELFKLYPGTRVYLRKSNSEMGFGQGRIDPVMESFVREDIFLVGFKGVDIPDVIGNPQTEDYGYLLAFEQDLDDLNFFQTSDTVLIEDSAADRANHLQDSVTIYGKHVSRFVTV